MILYKLYLIKNPQWKDFQRINKMRSSWKKPTYTKVLWVGNQTIHLFLKKLTIDLVKYFLLDLEMV